MGCGWLGLPLASSLVEDGYRVHGSTTSNEKVKSLEEKGIRPFVILLHEQAIDGDIYDFLQQIEVLVLNVPPKLRSGAGENYVKKMELLHSEIKKSAVRKIIFISSTSVYGTVDGKVTEETTPVPITESGKQLFRAETLFHADADLQTTVVRFGGLIGPDRHPITMLTGKKGLSNGNAPINLIHLNDCIHIIKAIFLNSWYDEIINGVYPYHPTKRQYYGEEARKRNLQEPDYQEDTEEKSKIIVPKTLLTVKNYKFTTSL